VSRRCGRGAAAALALTALANAAAAVDDPPPPPAGLTLISPDGGRVDWAPRGDWIAYDRVDPEGYSRLYVARPDGRERRCLTCQPLEFRRRHTGNPTWHPSGRYLVFEVEKPFRRAGAPEAFLRVPGRNLGSDLWAISFDGRTFFRLTGDAEGGSNRVHSPRFSHEGDRLVWAERVAGGSGWGEWELRVAEIGDRRGVPRLGKVRQHSISRDHRFLEPYGFTTDDRGLLLAANRPPNGPEAGLDLFLLRLDGGEATRLTGDGSRFNRFARLAPNGRWLVWATDRELGRRPGAAVALELWMMRDDGGEARRLTRFSDVFAGDYTGPVAVRSAAWSPEGDRLLVLAAPVEGSTSGSLYQLVLDRAYGR
jgi:Tol biopolymer transport system component